MCEEHILSNKRESAKIYYALLEILELNNIYKMKRLDAGDHTTHK